MSEGLLLERGSKQWVVVDKELNSKAALPVAENDKEAGATTTSNKSQGNKDNDLSAGCDIEIERKFYKPKKKCVSLVEAIPP